MKPNRYKEQQDCHARQYRTRLDVERIRRQMDECERQARLRRTLAVMFPSPLPPIALPIRGASINARTWPMEALATVKRVHVMRPY